MIKFICITTICILSAIAVKAQSSIETLCNGAADNIYKQLKKADIASHSKIAVLYFEGQTGSSNSIKSLLGMRISNKVATYLAKKFNNKEYTILMPENTQEKRYFSPPNTPAEEEQFYRKLNENQRPDYFISGKYHISSDYTSLAISELSLKENKYKEGSTGKPYAFDPFKTTIISADIEEIKNLNIEFSENDDFMNKILQFSEISDDLFSCAVIDVATKKIMDENEKLIINRSYTIKVEVKKACFLYAFYYMPEDKDHPYLQPLFPFENGQPKIFEPGTHNIPDNSEGFVIDPPVGNTYIKIFASVKPLTLNITSKKDKEGYFETSISYSDAEIFFTSLKSLQKQRVLLKTQIMTFGIDYK